MLKEGLYKKSTSSSPNTTTLTVNPNAKYQAIYDFDKVSDYIELNSKLTIPISKALKKIVNAPRQNIAFADALKNELNFTIDDLNSNEKRASTMIARIINYYIDTIPTLQTQEYSEFNVRQVADLIKAYVSLY